jgi:hypothetical protein
VEAIGWTGWDWSARKSRAIGFDFDAITGHAKGIGVSNEELERVKQAAMSLPYVEVRRSTGGAGIHLYIYFDEAGIPTANHVEHAALGRCGLGMMSSETGFDFASHIDACGSNMWFWHRKMTKDNEGLKLIKAAEKTISLADLPPNWRDHIEVVTRRRAKVRVHAELKDEFLDPFEALTSARRVVVLDEAHKAIIDELSHSGFSTIWVPDHHLLQTHTKALEKLMEESTLKLQGIFRTNSKGNNPGTPNCFMFPLEKGGWRVYRFFPGVQEVETWSQDKEGWTNCYFNCKPNLATAAKAMGAQEDPERGGFMFKNPAEAKKAAETLGQKIELPDVLLKEDCKHKARLKAHKDGRLVMHITKKPSEKKALPGWIDKGSKWVKVFDVMADTKHAATATRRLITSKELDSTTYELDYLIKDTLVAKQPCLLGGAKKALKTSIAIDMAISLATTTPFLGRFSIKRPCKVVVLSGESGIATLQETARRICESKDVRLADIENLFWSTFLPMFNNTSHLNALKRMIHDAGCEVLIVDPAYLCMPGTDAANLFKQGEMLRRVSELCERNGVGLVLAHHTKKGIAKHERKQTPRA